MKTRDPRGVAPERSELTLLLVDVINDFDFPESDKLKKTQMSAANPVMISLRALRSARGDANPQADGGIFK